MPSPAKVVLDTNVIVSALIKPEGKPALILKMAQQREFILCVCDEVFAEYREVLRRDKFAFDPVLIQGTLDYLWRLGAKISPLSRGRQGVLDPKDAVFYDLAKTMSAILVTGNMRHFPPDDKMVMTPADFLNSYAENR